MFFSSNLADLFYLKWTQKALGHSKDTRESLNGHLINQRTLPGHSKDIWLLKTFGHWSTWILGYSKYLDIWILGHLKGHLGTQSTFTKMAITNEFSISKVNYDGVALLLGIRLLNMAKKGKNNNSRRKSKLS